MGGITAAVAGHDLTGPPSTRGGAWPARFHAFRAGMVRAGTRVPTADPAARAKVATTSLAAFASSLAAFAAEIADARAPSYAAALAVRPASIGPHAVILAVLVLSTFGEREATTGVLLAATCLRAVAGPRGLIPGFVPYAFAPASGGTVGWGQPLYYGQVITTALGDGEIPQVGHVGQSVAAFQAKVGTPFNVLPPSQLLRPGRRTTGARRDGWHRRPRPWGSRSGGERDCRMARHVEPRGVGDLGTRRARLGGLRGDDGRGRHRGVAGDGGPVADRLHGRARSRSMASWRSIPHDPIIPQVPV